MNSSHELSSTRLAVMGCSASQFAAGVLRMPSSIVRHPVRPGAKVQSEQELEFDRWRTAIDIIKRMREAGINCKLLDDLQDRH